MNHSFLQGNRVILRAMEPEDLSFLYMIENNPELWSIGSFTVPYSRFVLKEYIRQSQYDLFADKQLRLMIVRKEDDLVIGTIDITDFVPIHNRGAVGIALLREFRKNGYAAEALGLLCRYAFEFLHLKQLYAHIPADNTDSIRLFSAAGFTHSGVLKHWLRSNGEYRDALIVQRVIEK